jgi:hypothetical protein
VSSQATFKAATEETRDRAERGSAVRGSDRATVVAEEDTLTDHKQRSKRHAQKPSARLLVEDGVSDEVALAAPDRGCDAAAGVVHVLLAPVEHIAIPTKAAARLNAEQIA